MIKLNHVPPPFVLTAWAVGRGASLRACPVIFLCCGMLAAVHKDIIVDANKIASWSYELLVDIHLRLLKIQMD